MANSHPGASAEHPTQFSWRAWRDVGKRTLAQVPQANLTMIAAGVAFYLFLALFPAIAAAVSIYGLVADPNEVQRSAGALQGVLPPQAAEIITGQMAKIAAQSGAALGVGAAIGIVLALWSAAGGTKALIQALNIAYKERERRGFLRLNAMALLLTLGGIVALVVAVGTVAVLPAVLGSLGLPGAVQAAIAWGRWPLLAVAMMTALAVLYRYAPSRQAPRWRWVSAGAVVATLLWLVASALFSWYSSRSGSYNATYGSIAAIVILLMWFYISAFVVLLGAELNGEMEHQTARDTTTGAPEPLGAREAKMADTVVSAPTAHEATPPPQPVRASPAGAAAARGDLEQQIAYTRERLDATLQSLGERLTPEQMAERFKGAWRATAGEQGERRPLLLGTLGAASGALLALALSRQRHSDRLH